MATDPGGLHLWQWRYTDDFGKRRIFPCRLTDEDAKRLRNAERVEGSLEIRTRLEGSTSDFQRSPRTSSPADTTNPPGSFSGSGTSKD